MPQSQTVNDQPINQIFSVEEDIAAAMIRPAFGEGLHARGMRKPLAEIIGMDLERLRQFAFDPGGSPEDVRKRVVKAFEISTPSTYGNDERQPLPESFRLRHDLPLGADWYVSEVEVEDALGFSGDTTYCLAELGYVAGGMLTLRGAAYPLSAILGPWREPDLPQNSTEDFASKLVAERRRLGLPLVLAATRPVLRSV